MAKEYILGIDEGTSLVKVLILDRNGSTAGSGSSEIPLLIPREGYVEQNPMVIWETTYALIGSTLASYGISPGQIAAIGIANQRETSVFWSRKTGLPYGNAIVWMDKRTASLCAEVDPVINARIVDRAGMYVIPNTAGMIVSWMLKNDEAVRRAAEKGDLCFGTVNSWLLWKLTGGAVHASDAANMSITLMQNARKVDYDDETLAFLQIPRDILPELRGTGEIFGTTADDLFSGKRIPIAGMLGDQMAAALGQGCIEPGMVKNTYGTGSFSVINTGSDYVPPVSGLFSSFLWGSRKEPTYALEGFSEICGAAVDWLKNNMGLIKDASETESIAQSVESGGRLYFVPAFNGLGTPSFDAGARGTLLGLTLESTAAHVVKAVLEGIVYQTTDMIRTMEHVTKRQISTLRVDGGMARNNYVCQFQADLLGRPVERPRITESTALGAIYQAGLTIGLWSSLAEIADLWHLDRRFEPACPEQKRELLYAGWLEAVERSRNWIRKD